MKKLILITILITTIGYGQQDKQKHFAAGAVISGAVYYFTTEIAGGNANNAFWASWVVGTWVGMAKEAYDPRWDWGDLGATSLGAVSVSIPLNIFDKKGKEKHKLDKLKRNEHWAEIDEMKAQRAVFKEAGMKYEKDSVTFAILGKRNRFNNID